jgi:hypothetical protein
MHFVDNIDDTIMRANCKLEVWKDTLEGLKSSICNASSVLRRLFENGLHNLCPLLDIYFYL